MKNTIQFAAKQTDLNKNDFGVIFYARKSLLFHSNHSTYDGADICELVGIFMLSLLSKKYISDNKNLYCEDGLSVFRNISGQQTEKHKIITEKIFKDKGLQIIIKCNLKIVIYLDVTLNLNDSTYRPFHKPNEETTYIHVESDHLPQIIRKIPRSIKKRLSRLSSTKEIFESSKDYYEQRLRQCGYDEKSNYTEEKSEINQKFRKHNIFWFNSPYSKSVKTNVGKLFLRLINKHFPPMHKHRKIFNRNNIKISYLCMTNMNSKLSTHNKKILNKPVNQNTRKCNCINKNICPLNGNCLLKNILYLATTKSDKKN